MTLRNISLVQVACPAGVPCPPHSCLTCSSSHRIEQKDGSVICCCAKYDIKTSKILTNKETVKICRQ